MKPLTMLDNVLRSLFQASATWRYPSQKRDTPTRLRGRLHWTAKGCTGCALCQKDCPANAIELITVDKAQKLFAFRYHADRCTFCGQCVQSCRFNCIELRHGEWELAALKRDTFNIYHTGESDAVDRQPQHNTSGNPETTF